MYQQRAPSPEPRLPRRPRIWRPEVEREDGSTFHVRPEASDRYVVIDDLEYGGVVFDIAPWPALDGEGRLVFGAERETRVVELARAQALIDAAREKVRQLPRPLRVGDAFQVRRLAGDIEGWTFRADITRPARDAARLALFAAVAPRLAPEQAERLPARAERPARAEQDRGPSGPGTARPAV